MTKRLLLLGCGGIGVALIGAELVVHPQPRFVWNSSASAPEGLYRVSSDAPVAVGDMVIARVPARFRALTAARHYIPANVPLVKQVAAGPAVRSARSAMTFIATESGSRIAARSMAHAVRCQPGRAACGSGRASISC